MASNDIKDVEKTEHRDGYEDDSQQGDGAPIHWDWMRVGAIMSLAGIYVGSQIPLYFVGGCLSFIAADIGATTTSVWIPVSYQLAVAALTPFCGYLEDGFGKRNIVLAGCLACCVGVIIAGTAQGFAQIIVGLTITGMGAAPTELTALAGVAELLPVSKRGYGMALVTLFLVPVTPYVMYSQLLSVYVTWRWTMWISLIICALPTVGLIITYWPKSEHTAVQNRKEMIKSIDWLGGFLSIVGVILFLVGLQAGGYTHPWTSAGTLAPLIIGLLLIVAFVVWEAKFAKNPMVPGGLFHGQRIVAGCFLISFVAGMNFYSLLNFYPLTFSAVYDPAPVAVGLKGLGYGISVTAGATIGNALISSFKGRNRELLAFGAILMTAFSGALASLTPETPGMAVAFGTLAGFGVGILLVPPAVVAACVVPDNLIATAVALVVTLRFVGGAIGYTIYYAIFTDKITGILPVQVGTYAVGAGLNPADATEFVTTFLTAPADVVLLPYASPAIVAAATEGTRWAYSKALTYVWYTSIPFGIITIAVALFLPDIRKWMTSRVAVNIGRK
ncbi:hypothetical protein CKM354_000640400 [Cercospora kikuchii]|uniref:Major facilitator superfamily (MFS) profile domain-containing protein n=1 Tax=Cercospora kikuchii TaxID=84275 RepID=A0A9P3CI29_9PEZI|nr:uncharacterized protein CKM354_000640400 [Cercospora kikuchii]GIZ43166.1 hypothetical protein CKM354_000640400 [Cercospora kikuchii]